MRDQKNLDNRVKHQKCLSYYIQNKEGKKVNSFLNEDSSHKYQMGKITCELNVKN